MPGRDVMTDLASVPPNVPKLVVRVDANPEIALGHLKRCLSLAEALRRVGMESVFVTNGDPESRRLLDQQATVRRSSPYSEHL